MKFRNLPTLHGPFSATRTLPILLGLVLLQAAALTNADTLILTAGGGKQPNADQHNRTVGLDYGFYEFRRSRRQTISVGVSVTYLETDFDSHKSAYSISFYPQLTLYPGEGSWVRRHMPTRTTAYFFIRALGPSYISDTRLGKRKQSQHFTFQAQVGVGLRFKSGLGRENSLSVSWKHFSNANLFSDNEGFDFPVVLNFGVHW